MKTKSVDFTKHLKRVMFDKVNYTPDPKAISALAASIQRGKELVKCN